ncbi:hypothetical protein CupriaWKF_31085 [Cupriavidus sp. WKF15]|uniref:hypothetical protein n=1 Tax=Cupriavidus sp. WKF15 TaxID=3032282 RepID=UPI0023E18FCF|nr:hypothetical protein [Cupriavidus sp. WKF15]WER50799.1 hypothetical protein CupriaWKF_31085 [Cupriavidus sp. WKF15]
MKHVFLTLMATAVVAGGVCLAQAATDGDMKASNYISIPTGYRNWTLVSVAREEGTLDDLRAILGNRQQSKLCRTANIPYRTAPSSLGSHGIMTR